MTITIEPKEIAELAKLFTSQSRLNDVYYSFCRVCEQLFDEEARNKPPEFQRRKLVFSSNGDFIEGGLTAPPPWHLHSRPLRSSPRRRP